MDQVQRKSCTRVINIVLPKIGRGWHVDSALSSMSSITRLAKTTDTGTPVRCHVPVDTSSLKRRGRLHLSRAIGNL